MPVRAAVCRSHHKVPDILSPLSIVLRVVFGTTIFALIVWLATHFPTAAGLMLTFPALNGLAFIFSRHDNVGAITATMLWMPLINGALCLAYLALFIMLATPAYVTAIAWGLTAGIALLWLALVTRPLIQRGVPSRMQYQYAMTVALFGAGMTLAWLLLTGSAAAGTAGAAKPALNWLRVILFSIALGLLIVLPPRFKWKDGASGILSGLPLVALAGMLSVAQDSAIDLEIRRALFMQMMFGVWLAPAMAVMFIFGVSRVLTHRRAHDLRASVVAAGWLLCFTAIIVTGAALQWLATH